MKSAYAAILVMVGLVAYTAGRWRAEVPVTSASTHRILYYHDPMHPAYKSSQPGVAPDCGMKLEPVFADGSPAVADAPPGTIQISPEKQQLIGVRTVEARRQPVTHLFRMPGRVAVDEMRIYKVATKVDGWVRHIYPVTTGAHVLKGQPLVSIYGRDYRMAQQAYIYALNALDKVQKDPDPTKDLADSLEQTKLQVSEALANLQNMWVDAEQIAEIARTRQAQFDTRLAAPAEGFILVRNVSINQKFDAGTELYRLVDLSHVWIVADLFASESQYVRSGMQARISLPAYPGKALPAQVSDILPQFDNGTRTLKLRLEAANRDFALRPDMLVDVELAANLPPAVTVPSDATIDTGLASTVFVDRGNGNFEPRPVETGWRFDNQVQIVKGIEPGERVVASATFLVDSESRLRQAALRKTP